MVFGPVAGSEWDSVLNRRESIEEREGRGEGPGRAVVK